jgi:hypothetical protein
MKWKRMAPGILLVFGFASLATLTFTAQRAEGCSGSPPSQGGASNCTKEVWGGVALNFETIPADGPILYHIVNWTVPCDSPKGTGQPLTITLKDEAGALLDGASLATSPIAGAVAWKPAVPLKPKASYVFLVDGFGGSPSTHSFTAGEPFAAPLAALSKASVNRKITAGKKDILCTWHTTMPGTCPPYQVSASYSAQDHELLSLLVDAQPQPLYGDFFTYKIRWDGGASNDAYAGSLAIDFESLPGKCLHLEVANRFSGATAQSPPDCPEMVTLNPDKLNCERLQDVLKTCNSAGAPQGSGYNFGKGTIATDVSALVAACAGGPQAGGAGGQASGGGNGDAGGGEAGAAGAGNGAGGAQATPPDAGCALAAGPGRGPSWWALLALLGGRRKRDRRPDREPERRG